jgi:hypothetical protein
VSSQSYPPDIAPDILAKGACLLTGRRREAFSRWGNESRHPIPIDLSPKALLLSGVLPQDFGRATPLAD